MPKNLLCKNAAKEGVADCAWRQRAESPRVTLLVEMPQFFGRQYTAAQWVPSRQAFLPLAKRTPVPTFFSARQRLLRRSFYPSWVPVGERPA